MAGKDDAENLGGNASGGARDRTEAGRAVGQILLALAQPDLFGVVLDAEAEARVFTLRRRRVRIRRRRAAETLLAEPWRVAAGCGPADAVALARRFLRRHPDRDRPDPAPPLLTARQEAAAWHAEEEIADQFVGRDRW